MAKKAQNCQLQLDFSGANSDVPARTPPQNESVHGEKSTSSHFICSEQSRLDGTLKDAGTEGEYIIATLNILDVINAFKSTYNAII